ncbi:gp53-like domain-containing protein [Paraburkholderia sp. RL17-381-BIF-C]|uniref:gp53-like domain-containing protein n=1 Tax=Paraburkholderia sp. RL17-381-BIF-C TaxID=3031635 RepID=UPI0038BB9C73
MFRIDDATAATSLPTPEAAGTEGYWTEGNPATGTPATNVRGSWLNMIQEELRAIVVAGGLTPSKTTYTQVRDALLALFAKVNGDSTKAFSVAAAASSNQAVNLGQFVTSLLTSGYVKIPNVSGTPLILQWFPINNTASTTSSGTFPIAFPNNCFAVTLTGLQATGNTQAYAVLNGKTLTGFNWSAFAATGGTPPSLSSSSGGVQGYGFAIGN